MKHKVLNIFLACVLAASAFGAGYTVIKITGTLYTDDTLLVGNGTDLAVKTVPNCTDTGGNHLNYTQSSNAFSCGTSGGSSFPLLAPDGSSGAPSYSFTNSTTSGIYYDSGNSQIVVASAVGLRFASLSGAFTLGTSSRVFAMASAIVGSGCSLGVSNGITSASSPGTGVCQLLFAFSFGSVPACTATVATSGTTDHSAFITNTASTGQTEVTTTDLTGMPSDAGFTVTCIGASN